MEEDTATLDMEEDTATLEGADDEDVIRRERRRMVPIPSCECLLHEHRSEGVSCVDVQELLDYMLAAGAPKTTKILVTTGFGKRGMVFLLLSLVYWVCLLVFHRGIFPNTLEKTSYIFVTLVCGMALWLCVECLALRFLVRRAVVSPVCGRFVEYWSNHRVRSPHRIRSGSQAIRTEEEGFKTKFLGFQKRWTQFLLQVVGISLLFWHDFSIHIVVLACDFGLVTALTGGYREVLKFIQTMSRAPGEHILKAIYAVRDDLATDSGKPRDLFWQDALRAYRHIEHGLYDLYEVVSLSLAIWLVHRYMVVVVLVAILEAAFYHRAEWYQALAAVVGAYIAVKAAAKTLFDLYKISFLYGDSTPYVGGHAKPPTLYSAASQVLGCRGLTDQENIDIDRFLRYLERSTAGAQIFKQQIDAALLLKLSATVSLFTCGVNWIVNLAFT